MKSKVVDGEILSKCKSILDDWSATRPYTPTRRLGADSELVNAVSHTLERFTLTTGMRTRQKECRRLKNGSEYNRNPTSIDAYDIWDDVGSDEKRADVEFALGNTTFAKECKQCRGEGTVVCKDCGGKGWKSCRATHSTVCDDKGNFHHNMVEQFIGLGAITGIGAVKTRDGKTWVECPCHGTGRIECDCDNGRRTCEACSGTGYLVYQWFIVQKYKELSSVKTWKPSDGLTDTFCAFDRLGWNELWKEEIEDARYNGKYPVERVSAMALKAMQDVSLAEAWELRIAEVDKEIEKFKKENEGSSYRTSFEHVVFEQYDGIVEYDYKYDGKIYKVWINLATGGVEETENGLYASMAEETVNYAQEAEKKGVPQDAIYYYCKADAISLKWGLENGTQKKRVRQYRMIGAFFGGAFLVASLAVWLPTLLMSGLNGIGVAAVCFALATMTFCMVSLNEAIQLIGLALPFAVAYAARMWFGEEMAADLVTREGLLFALLAQSLVMVTLTTDSVQRLPGGRKGLVFAGLVAGLIAAFPISMLAAIMTQSFIATGSALLVMPLVCLYSLIRLPTRLRAGKMQKFVQKNDGKGDKIRAVIEGRKPGREGLVTFLMTVVGMSAIGLISLLLRNTVDNLFGGMHLSLIQTLQGWGVL